MEYFVSLLSTVIFQADTLAQATGVKARVKREDYGDPFDKKIVLG